MSVQPSQRRAKGVERPKPAAGDTATTPRLAPPARPVGAPLTGTVTSATLAPPESAADSRSTSVDRGGRPPALMTRLCDVSGVPATPGRVSRSACSGGDTTDHEVVSAAGNADATVALSVSFCAGLTFSLVRRSTDMTGGEDLATTSSHTVPVTTRSPLETVTVSV